MQTADGSYDLQSVQYHGLEWVLHTANGQFKDVLSQ